MKHTTLLILLLGTFAAQLQAAPPVTRPATAIEKHAYAFLTGGKAASELEAYLKDLGVAQGKRHDAIVAALGAMRAARDEEEAEAGSVAFWEIVDEKLGSKAPKTEPAADAGTGPGAGPKTAVAKKVRPADQTKFAELVAQEAALKPLLAAYDKELAAAADGKPKQDATRKRDETSFKLTVNHTAQRLLVAKFAAEEAQKAAGNKTDDAAAQVTAASTQQAKVETETKYNALLEKMATEDLGALRKYGLSITAGYGYLGKMEKTAGVAQVKYHFFQRQDLRDRALRKLQGTEEPASSSKLKWVKTTAISGWVGTTLGALKQKDPLTGTEYSDKPLLAGIGLGFGNGIEGSSTVHIDGGIALFNATGFRKDDWYVGVSVDAVLFKQIVKAIGEVTSGD